MKWFKTYIYEKRKHIRTYCIYLISYASHGPNLYELRSTSEKKKQRRSDMYLLALILGAVDSAGIGSAFGNIVRGLKYEIVF